MNETIDILFDEPSKAFQSHLELPLNERIIFSGIYGIGKTTFLRHYFQRKEVKEKYNAIHLFPVNYSILENEDVFSYLKYDILYELVETHKFEFEFSHFSKLLALPFFLRQNALQIFATFLLLIPKMGKQLFQFSEEMKKLKKQFEKLQSGGENCAQDAISQFIESFHKEEGGAYENNFVTQLIIQALEDLKGENEKQNILVIDDLDRIDPHHVFRLFNVFAAHFDQRHGTENSNKFGFDQVIFVCDLENIYALFKSQYGLSVDFNGYIDKFYSREIFNFENSQSISDTIDIIFDERMLQDDLIKNGATFFQLQLEVFQEIKFIFKSFVLYRVVNLRTLLKFMESKLKPNFRKLELVQPKRTIAENKFRSLIMTNMLLQFFGNFDYLIEVVEKCAKQFSPSKRPEISESTYARMIGDLLLIIGEDKNGFRFNNKEKTVFNYKGIPIQFMLLDLGPNEIAGIVESNEQFRIDTFNYFDLYSDFLKILKREKYFKN